MSTKRPSLFLTSDEGISARDALVQLQQDIRFNTPASYSTNIVAHPDNRQSFVEKHMDYLVAHPALDPTQYVSNLRLKTRIR